MKINSFNNLNYSNFSAPKTTKTKPYPNDTVTFTSILGKTNEEIKASIEARIEKIQDEAQATMKDSRNVPSVAKYTYLGGQEYLNESEETRQNAKKLILEASKNNFENTKAGFFFRVQDGQGVMFDKSGKDIDSITFFNLETLEPEIFLLKPEMLEVGMVTAKEAYYYKEGKLDRVYLNYANAGSGKLDSMQKYTYGTDENGNMRLKSWDYSVVENEDSIFSKENIDFLKPPEDGYLTKYSYARCKDRTINGDFTKEKMFFDRISLQSCLKNLYESETASIADNELYFDSEGNIKKWIKKAYCQEGSRAPRHECAEFRNGKAVSYSIGRENYTRTLFGFKRI